MQDPLEDRLAAARRTTEGEVHRSLVGSVRILLMGLVAVPLLLVILSTFFVGMGSITREGTIVLLVFSAIAVAGLALLRLGRVEQAVGLVIIGVLAGLAWETAVTGVVGFAAFLFAYSIPIAFAALTVGRWALIASAGASIGVVLVVHLLERAGVPWIASDVDIPMAGTVVIAFALITTFLALVLDRFGVELKAAHDAALQREAELARLVSELESQMEERKQAESRRDAAEKERERLFELERRARQDAESSSSKLSFLAEASHLLATTRDLGATLRQLTDLVVPRWADWCSIDLLDEEGRLEPFTVAHPDRRKAEWALEKRRRFRVRAGPLSSAAAIASGKTQLLRQANESDLEQAAQDSEHLAVLKQMGITSAVVVPLIIRGNAAGALTLVSNEEGRLYGEDDVVFFEELAARAAIGIDNSRLFEQTRRLNRDLEGRVEQRTHELRNALSELEAFAYSVSHDLRSPLRGIDGFSTALLEDYRDRLDPAGVESLERIRRAASRMGHLIDALLTLSGLARADLQIQEVDLSEIALTLTRELREGDPYREVEVTVEPGMRVRGDPELLQAAVGAIIGNAWKFTRKESRARIEIGSEELNGERVYFVRDNGVGFDMAYYNKLFSPFQRLHTQQFEGTGIGLALAQRVVMRHGGRIWAEAEVEEGATFYFTIGI